MVLLTFPFAGGGDFTSDYCGSAEEARARAVENARDFGFEQVTWSEDGVSGWTERRGEWEDQASFRLLTFEEYDRFMGGE